MTAQTLPRESVNGRSTLPGAHESQGLAGKLQRCTHLDTSGLLMNWKPRLARVASCSSGVPVRNWYSFPLSEIPMNPLLAWGAKSGVKHVVGSTCAWWTKFALALAVWIPPLGSRSFRDRSFLRFFMR